LKVNSIPFSQQESLCAKDKSSFIHLFSHRSFCLFNSNSARQVDVYRWNEEQAQSTKTKTLNILF